MTGKRILLAGFIAVLAFGAAAARAADSKEEPVGLILSAPGGKVTRAGHGDAACRALGGHSVLRRCAESDRIPGQLPLLPGEIVADARRWRRSSSRREAAESEDRQTRPAEARQRVLPSATCARGRREPAALRRQHDARPGKAGRRRDRGRSTGRQPSGRRSSLLKTPCARTRPTCRRWSRKPLSSIRIISTPMPSPRIAASSTAWTDAVWVRGRIFELEESLATQAALKAAEISPDAKTYALMIGISKYQKLPQGALAAVRRRRRQDVQPASRERARRRRSGGPDGRSYR